MLDTRLQAQFTKSCTAAALSYASAATATYAAAMTSTFDFWMSSMQPMTASGSAGGSRYRAPQRSPYGAQTGLPLPAFTNWVSPFGQAPVHPFAAWMDFLPVRGPATAWPMAYFMISMGIPRSIAWPTAEANASAIEAAEIANTTMQRVFSSYRSDGGHAVAQLASPTQAMTAMALAPIGFAAMAPWLNAWRAFG